mgnify:CR=1 FL=1
MIHWIFNVRVLIKCDMDSFLQNVSWKIEYIECFSFTWVSQIETFINRSFKFWMLILLIQDTVDAPENMKVRVIMISSF